jgi:two-component system response regulator AtoC
MERLRNTILLIDDEKPFLEFLQEKLLEMRFNVFTASNEKEALDLIKKQNIDVALLDIRMPDVDGVTLLKRLKKIDPTLEIIMLTGYASLENAIEAMKDGAYDFLTKPCQLSHLGVILQKACEKVSLSRQNINLREGLLRILPNGEIIGQSEAMRAVLGKIEKISDSSSPVLIEGESGTGKELVANAIHHRSPRASHPFVVINCGGLQESLIENELFGHEKGAYTSADRKKIGLFEVANMGILFLDEIGELGPSAQTKLLRVLELGEYRPLGSVKQSKVDVRIIAATNKNLMDEVKAKHFREDLYYRLNVISIKIPPLRERKSDIPLFVKYYLDKRGISRNREIHVSEEAMGSLINHDWPGNIRELFNAIEYAMTVSNKDSIEIEDLPINITRHQRVGVLNEWMNLKEVEKEYIGKVLRAQGGNLQRTARILNISRPTLYKKLRKYRITN